MTSRKKLPDDIKRLMKPPILIQDQCEWKGCDKHFTDTWRGKKVCDHHGAQIGWHLDQERTEKFIIAEFLSTPKKKPKKKRQKTGRPSRRRV